MHIPIVFCCGVKKVYTNKLSKCWCHIIKPYLFTKFHVFKPSGNSYTNMHANVWAEVYCSFPKRCLKNLFPVRHETVYHYHV